MTCDAVMTPCAYRLLPPAIFVPLSQTNDCSFRHPLQDRPCTRCIKRNIGHLCHDESRETPSRRSKSEPDHAVLQDEPAKNELGEGQDMPAFPLRDESARPYLQNGAAGLRVSTQEEGAPGLSGSMTQGHGSDSTTQPRELSQPGRLVSKLTFRTSRTRI
jgi:hypothetical protein